MMAGGLALVEAFASGLLSVMGHDPTIVIKDYQGQVEFDPETPEKASLTMEEKVLEVDKRLQSLLDHRRFRLINWPRPGLELS